ncbi:MAG: hypothetical protein IPO77_18940 [Acidobacteria bacterium]|nr:hypothetical protein [Acidobacteriota bacterium]
MTINSIEEDTIVITVRTTQTSPFGNRDLVVTNPNGEVVRRVRAHYVS